MHPSTSDFLEADGDTQTFATGQELVQLLRAKTFRQSARRQARLREDQGERFALRQYLMTMETAGRLAFPLRITKTERPDFWLAGPAGDAGFEITQVTTTELSRDTARARRSQAPSMVEYTPTGHRMVAPGGRLTGSGFHGYQDSDRMADLATRRVQAKLERLNSCGFHHAASDQLLMFENYGLVLDLSDTDTVGNLAGTLIALVKGSIAASPFPRTFDAIHFMVDHLLFVDLLGHCDVLASPTARAR